MVQKIHDIAVVGGGINGCGIARDAAGRGLSVLLAEQGDLAGATSSASTKLIHGGLRYLEYYEFRLVREALKEREVLLRAAPHIIWPLRFVLPHHRGLRPAWFIRLGLLLYDQLGGRQVLPATRGLDLRRDRAGEPLKESYVRAFEYSDCWVEDARLVVLNAVDAAERGAEILPRTRVESARRDEGLWHLVLSDVESGRQRESAARILVNATGPWAGDFLALRAQLRSSERMRLVKGSHIVVPRLFEHERAYIFQNDDGRIVFAIPFEGDYTLIGTTEVDYHGDPAAVAIEAGEIDYLCAAVGTYFARPPTPADVVWSYSGVRPLHDEGEVEAKAATRDYLLKMEAPPGAAPLLNVFGGKITTYRKLAEAALSAIETHLPVLGTPWTANVPLPGGDFPVQGFEAQVRALRAGYPFLEGRHARRLTRAYGTRAKRLLGRARDTEDLGPAFGADLYPCEVDYLMTAEWARNAEDVLWRRSKLGLRLSADEAAELDRWMRRVAAV